VAFFFMTMIIFLSSFNKKAMEGSFYPSMALTENKKAVGGLPIHPRLKSLI
jgi:hypothetical protein